MPDNSTIPVSDSTAYIAGDKSFNIPNDKKQEFLKDFPDAKEANLYIAGGKRFNILDKDTEAFKKDLPDAKLVQSVDGKQPDIPPFFAQIKKPQSTPRDLTANLTPSSDIAIPQVSIAPGKNVAEQRQSDNALHQRVNTAMQEHQASIIAGQPKPVSPMDYLSGDEKKQYNFNNTIKGIWQTMLTDPNATNPKVREAFYKKYQDEGYTPEEVDKLKQVGDQAAQIQQGYEQSREDVHNNPNDPHKIGYLGGWQVAAGDYDKAQKTFKYLIQNYPKEGHGYAGLAYINAIQGNIPLAIKTLDIGLNKDTGNPDNVMMLTERAKYLAQTGYSDKALVDANHAVSTSQGGTQERVAALNEQANVLKSLGKTTEANTALQLAASTQQAMIPKDTDVADSDKVTIVKKALANPTPSTQVPTEGVPEGVTKQVKPTELKEPGSAQLTDKGEVQYVDNEGKVQTIPADEVTSIQNYITQKEQAETDKNASPVDKAIAWLPEYGMGIISDISEGLPKIASSLNPYDHPEQWKKKIIDGISGGVQVATGVSKVLPGYAGGMMLWSGITDVAESETVKKIPVIGNPIHEAVNRLMHPSDVAESVAGLTYKLSTGKDMPKWGKLSPEDEEVKGIIDMLGFMAEAYVLHQGFKYVKDTFPRGGGGDDGGGGGGGGTTSPEGNPFEGIKLSATTGVKVTDRKGNVIFEKKAEPETVTPETKVNPITTQSKEEYVNSQIAELEKNKKMKLTGDIRNVVKRGLEDRWDKANGKVKPVTPEEVQVKIVSDKLKVQADDEASPEEKKNNALSPNEAGVILPKIVKDLPPEQLPEIVKKTKDKGAERKKKVAEKPVEEKKESLYQLPAEKESEFNKVWEGRNTPDVSAFKGHSEMFLGDYTVYSKRDMGDDLYTVALFKGDKFIDKETVKTENVIDTQNKYADLLKKKQPEAPAAPKPDETEAKRKYLEDKIGRAKDNLSRAKTENAKATHKKNIDKWQKELDALPKGEQAAAPKEGEFIDENGDLTDKGFSHYTEALINIINKVSTKFNIPLQPLLRHYDISKNGEYVSSQTVLLDAGKSINHTKMINTFRNIAFELFPDKKDEINTAIREHGTALLNALENGDNKFVVDKHLSAIYQALQEINSNFNDFIKQAAPPEGQPSILNQDKDLKGGEVSITDYSKMSSNQLKDLLDKYESINTPEGWKIFSEVENELNGRERNSILQVPLKESLNNVEALIKQSQDHLKKDNVDDTYTDIKNLRETKNVIEKYLNPKDISLNDLKEDFKDGLLGRAETWYADTIKFREAAQELFKRGLTQSDVIKIATDVYVKDGYDLTKAKEVVSSKLEPLLKPKESPADVGKAEDKKEHKPEIQGKAQQLPQPELERQQGFKIVNGEKVERPKPITNIILGKQTKVRYAPNDVEPAQWAVVERKDVQPSHKSGVPNPKHFLPEAQPRDRSALKVLKQAAKLKGDNLHPDDLAESPNAFFGAPNINERGEGIQGNGRADAIDYYIDTYPKDQKGYKKMILDKADALGLDKDAIEKMQEPELVRLHRVSDARAIELGKYRAEGLEDVVQKGGKEKAAAAGMSAQDMAGIADMILRNDTGDETLNKLIAKGGGRLLQKLIDSNVIRADEKELFLKDGVLTPEAIKSITQILRQLLFKGGSTTLETSFNILPFKAENGLEKSILNIARVPENKTLLPEIQEAIASLAEYEVFRDIHSENGVKPKDTKKVFQEWQNKGDLMAASPNDRVSTVGMKIVELLHDAENQKYITDFFKKYADLVADIPANMFEKEIKGISKQEAIKKLLNLDYENQQEPISPAGARISNEANDDRAGDELKEAENKAAAIERQANSRDEGQRAEAVQKADELLNELERPPSGAGNGRPAVGGAGGGVGKRHSDGNANKDVNPRKVGVKAERPPLVSVNHENVPDPTVSVPTTYDLDKEQVYGVNVALSALSKPENKGFLLADGAGTGKTRLQLLAAKEMAEKTGKPSLIITQNQQIIDGGFGSVAKKWGLDLKKANIELGTYKQMADGKIGKGDYGLVVYDEAHNLKNAESNRSIAAANIKGDKYIYATATPFDKLEGAAYFIGELTGWTHEQVLKKLGLKITRTFDPDTKTWKTTTGLDEGVTPAIYKRKIYSLRDEVIAKGLMLRREYPFYGTIGEIHITRTPEETAEQDEIADHWDDKIADARGRAKMNLAGQRSGELRRHNETTKFRVAAREIENDIKAGYKPVVMAERIESSHIKGHGKESLGILKLLTDHFEAKGYKVAKIYGTGDKSAEVAKFQSGKADLAIATPESGSTGIDLDDQVGDAPRVLHMITPPYSGNVLDQALYRVSRKFTKSEAAVKMYWNDSPSDARSKQIVDAKLATLKAIQSGNIDDINTDEVEPKQFGSGENPAIKSLSPTHFKVVNGGKIYWQLKDLGGVWERAEKAMTFPNNRIGEIQDYLKKLNPLQPSAEARNSINHDKADLAAMQLSNIPPEAVSQFAHLFDGRPLEEILDKDGKTIIDALNKAGIIPDLEANKMMIGDKVNPTQIPFLKDVFRSVITMNPEVRQHYNQLPQGIQTGLDASIPHILKQAPEHSLAPLFSQGIVNYNSFLKDAPNTPILDYLDQKPDLTETQKAFIATVFHSNNPNTLPDFIVNHYNPEIMGQPNAGILPVSREQALENIFKTPENNEIANQEHQLNQQINAGASPPDEVNQPSRGGEAGGQDNSKESNPGKAAVQNALGAQIPENLDNIPENIPPEDNPDLNNIVKNGYSAAYHALRGNILGAVHALEKTGDALRGAIQTLKQRYIELYKNLAKISPETLNPENYRVVYKHFEDVAYAERPIKRSEFNIQDITKKIDALQKKEFKPKADVSDAENEYNKTIFDQKKATTLSNHNKRLQSEQELLAHFKQVLPPTPEFNHANDAQLHLYDAARELNDRMEKTAKSMQGMFIKLPSAALKRFQDITSNNYQKRLVSSYFDPNTDLNKKRTILDEINKYRHQEIPFRTYLGAKVKGVMQNVKEGWEHNWSKAGLIGARANTSLLTEPRSRLEAINLKDPSDKKIVEVQDDGTLKHWKEGIDRSIANGTFAKENENGNPSMKEILDNRRFFDKDGNEYSINDGNLTDIEKHIHPANPELYTEEYVKHPLIVRQESDMALNKLKEEAKFYLSIFNNPKLQYFMHSLSEEQSDVAREIGRDGNPTSTARIDKFIANHNEKVNTDEDFLHDEIKIDPKADNKTKINTILDAYEIPKDFIYEHTPASGWDGQGITNEVFDNTWIKNDAYKHIKNSLESTNPNQDAVTKAFYSYYMLGLKTTNPLGHASNIIFNFIPNFLSHDLAFNVVKGIAGKSNISRVGLLKHSIEATSQKNDFQKACQSLGIANMYNTPDNNLSDFMTKVMMDEYIHDRGYGGEIPTKSAATHDILHAVGNFVKEGFSDLNRAQQTVTWWVNDVNAHFAVAQEAARNGFDVRNVDWANPTTEDMQHLQKAVEGASINYDQYRLRSMELLPGKAGNVVSQVLRNKLLSIFSPFHVGEIKQLTSHLANVAQAPVTTLELGLGKEAKAGGEDIPRSESAEKLKKQAYSAEKLALIGFLTFYAYKKIEDEINKDRKPGEPYKTLTRSGMSNPVYWVQQGIEGKIPKMDAAEHLVLPSPAFSRAGRILFHANGAQATDEFNQPIMPDNGAKAWWEALDYEVNGATPHTIYKRVNGGWHVNILPYHETSMSPAERQLYTLYNENKKNIDLANKTAFAAAINAKRDSLPPDRKDIRSLMITGAQDKVIGNVMRKLMGQKEHLPVDSVVLNKTALDAHNSMQGTESLLRKNIEERLTQVTDSVEKENLTKALEYLNKKDSAVNSILNEQE